MSMCAGMTSENVAERYGITRQQQDEMAARSHKRAGDARASGRFKDEIVPVKTVWKSKEVRRPPLTSPLSETECCTRHIVCSLLSGNCSSSPHRGCSCLVMRAA